MKRVLQISPMGKNMEARLFREGNTGSAMGQVKP